MGHSPVVVEWLAPVTGWRLLGGVWLYAIIAGLSYAVRNAARLRKEERRAAEAETEAARARLEALRSRIQPHFLLNALHGISSLVNRDPVAAEEAMEQLGELLRYAVRARDSEFVTLKEEWSFVLGYLEMQSLRFGERLAYESEMEEDLATRLIPVFSLQPLVENAVLHGIETRPDGGRVHLTAKRTRSDGMNRMRLSVCDDGPGPSAESPTSGMGTGLDALSKRLHTLFGDRFDLSLTRDPAHGTCAVIELPLQPSDE
jgi:sensor histidine kinase YesM